METGADQMATTTDLSRAAAQAPLQTVEPEREGDRIIRHELSTVIARDAALKDRRITFTVDAGDIAVAGTVRTENDRQKINEIAMHINGVKSVANALRVAPD